MVKAADHYFSEKEEPAKSCLLALRHLILTYDNNISEAWKYGMPFYCYHGKMCLYLWTRRKTNQPYLGIVEGNRINHALLISEKRARMKILLIDPVKDIPVSTIRGLFEQVLALYR